MGSSSSPSKKAHKSGSKKASSSSLASSSSTTPSKRKSNDQPLPTSSSSSEKKVKTRENQRSSVVGDFIGSKEKPPSGKAVCRVSKAREAGPVLASFADFTPSPSTPFTLYRAEPLAGAPVNGEGIQDRLVLAGETDTIEYLGDNWRFGNLEENKGYTGEYMLGVYDPSTSSVTLRSAPLFTVSRSVKALNDLVGMADERESQDWSVRVQARRDLGEAFGNRKAKAAVRNQDRMKVDTRNMEGILDQVTEGIEDSTASLPTKEVLEATANQARPVPPANLQAEHPSEAYALSDLIPPNVLKQLSIKRLIDCQDQASLAAALPVPGPRHSRWLVTRTWSAVQNAQHSQASSSTTSFDSDGQAIPKPGGGEEARNRVKVALYIALLWAFRKNSKLADRSVLVEKLKLEGEQEPVLEDMIRRFTETQRGSNKPQLTTFSETKLLAYMFALCLHLDNFSVDSQSIASDLALAPKRVSDIFKSLGCTSADRVQHGIDDNSKEYSRKEKRMILKLPLVFPKVSRGGPPKKR
ncbi:RNA polymerase I associated factor, A49-like protein [Violaceomyces palustris]|uniref:RNA polymerase I associated factor, A49-like protein n=1 Tax=Violaceomyces palustris TaxID=1673888 RepID=A0ACD0P5U6_9BASI|nr:RNA polymerase I associated factor, A49-like protein [Violaceomyces palustris]